MVLLRKVRHGFTLIEVVVAALIVALLAAVAVPQLVDFIDKQQAQTTANILSSLATGIANYASLVKTGAGATNTSYPIDITELANPISTSATSGGAGSQNSCGFAYVATQSSAVTNWNANGPFVSFYVPSTGYVTPIGTVSNLMTRSPAGVATAGTLAMTMANVDYTDVVNLDAIVDGSDGATLGTVRWTPTGATSGPVTVTYLVPIGAKC